MIGTSKGKGKGWLKESHLSIVSILGVFILWFLVTRDGLGIVKPVIFPSPFMVIEAAISTSSLIGTDVLYTMFRVVCGLVTGTVLGITVGMLVCFNNKLYYLINPLIESSRPVPVIAMIPFFLMWFGIGEIGKFLLVTLGVFAIIVINTIEAIRNVQPIYVKAGQTLGAGKKDIFSKIILPSIIPALIGPIRVCVAISFTLVVAAEFMGAQAGMGYRILQARKMFNTDVIFLGVVMFGILSALVDTSIRKLLQHLTRWTERA
ncbi:ABC transporter permease [Lederbergia galactosidilytica]|uniref:ABC transporter permease n=1 Tax=Lederbergia galactosidilytica TaxID=217031 RepID=UPI000716E99E|nr:ABC transporter permease [Lederbergia galactosidilytica]